MQIPQNKLSIQEYYNKIDETQVKLDVEDFYIYNKLSKITDKYLLIPIGNVPTDNSGAYEKLYIFILQNMEFLMKN